jgi:hypothetical protein
LSVTVRLGGRALRRGLWRDEQLAGAFDVVGPNRAGEQADAVSAFYSQKLFDITCYLPPAVSMYPFFYRVSRRPSELPAGNAKRIVLRCPCLSRRLCKGAPFDYGEPALLKPALLKRPLLSSAQFAEHHELERKLRRLNYEQRMLAMLLIQAKCYDEPVRSEFELLARELTAKLARDPEALFAVMKLAGGAHIAAYRLGERAMEVQRIARARIQKGIKKQEDDLKLANAIKTAMQKVESSPARSDTYAALIYPHVLAALRLPKHAKRPSLWAIKQRIPARRSRQF